MQSYWFRLLPETFTTWTRISWSQWFFFFFFCWLFPLSGIKPASSALEAQNLNQWTTREVLSQWNFNWYFSYLQKYHLGTIFHTYILSIRESGWLFFQNKSQVCPCFSTFNVKNPVQASIIEYVIRCRSSLTPPFPSLNYSHNSQWLLKMQILYYHSLVPNSPRASHTFRIKF